jgi:FkbM family methyltransferase
MSSSLENLVRHGVNVQAVIDVGILAGTFPLMEVFSHVKHYLFEPVELYFDKIHKNYDDKGLDYELSNIALSDQDGDSYLIGISVDGGDAITHSQVSNRPVTKKEFPRLISCSKIRKAKLDSILKEITIPTPFLLKIDVDGHEMNILRGSKCSLKCASIVVIEAPLQKKKDNSFFERYQYLLENGFVLIDIVDPSYYNGILWQVDLIFIRQDLLNEQLRPFENPSFEFDQKLWNPFKCK